MDEPKHTSGGDTVSREASPVYNLRAREGISLVTLPVLITILGLVVTYQRNSSTDIATSISSAKSELREEFRSADRQLKDDIVASETRAFSQLRANENRDSKRFESLESQLLQVVKKR